MSVRKQITFQDDFFSNIELLLEYEDRTLTSLVNHAVRVYMRKSFKRMIENIESEKEFESYRSAIEEKVKSACARRPIKEKSGKPEIIQK